MQSIPQCFSDVLSKALAGADVENYGTNGSKKKPVLSSGYNSVTTTAAIIVADVAGAGILSMAVAVAKFGWLLGAIMVVVMLAMNVHVSIIMWRVRTKCHPEARTFMELARGAFARAPAKQQRFAVLFTGLTQQLLIAGFLGVYTLSLGKGLGMLFYNVHLCLPIWTLIGCLLTLPFVASARRLGSWSSLICVNCVSILATVAIPLMVLGRQGVDQSRIPGSTIHAVADLSLHNVMLGLSIMLFSFISQVMVVEIMAETKSVGDFPKAYLWAATPFLGIVFLVCGLSGYYFRGDLVKGIIVDSIPFGIWFQAAAACLIIHMVTTWLVKGIVFCRQLQVSWNPQSAEDGSTNGWLQWGALVTATMTVSYFIAQVVPFFVDLVNLLGAFLSPLVCFIIPIVLYRQCLRDFGTEEDRLSNAEAAVITLEFALAMFMFFVGTYMSLKTIVSSWQTYGYPFECHCQNLWNTCACSASHAGLEHCPVNM